MHDRKGFMTDTHLTRSTRMVNIVNHKPEANSNLIVPCWIYKVL